MPDLDLSPEVLEALGPDLIKEIEQAAKAGVAYSAQTRKIDRGGTAYSRAYSSREESQKFCSSISEALIKVFGVEGLAEIRRSRLGVSYSDGSRVDRGYDDTTLHNHLTRLVRDGIIPAAVVPDATVPVTATVVEVPRPMVVPDTTEDDEDDDEDDDDDEDEEHDYANCEECDCEDCDRAPKDCCGCCDHCDQRHYVEWRNDRTEEGDHGDRWCKECEHFCMTDR